MTSAATRREDCGTRVRMASTSKKQQWVRTGCDLTVDAEAPANVVLDCLAAGPPGLSPRDGDARLLWATRLYWSASALLCPGRAAAGLPSPGLPAEARSRAGARRLE